MTKTVQVQRQALAETRIVETANAPLGDGEVRLKVESFAVTANNVTYQPVVVSNLSSTNWTNLGPTIPGDGTTKSVTDSTATNSERRFYRLKIAPSP